MKLILSFAYLKKTRACGGRLSFILGDAFARSLSNELILRPLNS
ncbi:hypothetical protein [Campylobacter troglodytis]|nr:hypothetical protein [Campylobacter troglodytis]